MSRLLMRSSVGMGVLAATILLAKFWYIYPDLFPTSLRRVGNGIIDWLAIQGADRVADAELAYVLSVALVTVLIVALFIWAAIKRTRI